MTDLRAAAGNCAKKCMGLRTGDEHPATLPVDLQQAG